MQITEINVKKHANLRFDEHRVIEAITNKHMLTLRVNEVAQAASCFPIFLNQLVDTDDWAVSAVCGVQSDNNLFVVGSRWTPAFQPSSIQTFPFYLMAPSQGDAPYIIGFDEQENILNEEAEERLFTNESTPSPRLTFVTSLLESNVRQDVITFEFTRKLAELGLIKEVKLAVEYQDDSTHVIRGLNNIDEEKLQSLSTEEFESLRKLGYLAPIYAMLISVFHLNTLLKAHNLKGEGVAIKQIRIDPVEESVAGS